MATTDVDDFQPYEAFRYSDGKVICTFRIEDMFGISYSGEDRGGELTTIAQFADSCFMKISGFQDMAAVNRFISAVSAAVEHEEKRRAHNRAVANNRAKESMS